MGCCTPTKRVPSGADKKKMPSEFLEGPLIRYLRIEDSTLYTITPSKDIIQSKINIPEEMPRNPAFLEKENSLWLAGGRSTSDSASDLVFNLVYAALRWLRNHRYHMHPPKERFTEGDKRLYST
jgi:hypothetical protein